MPISPAVQATVIAGIAYFNIPKGPVLQVGQVATISGMAAGAAVNNTYWNQAWTVLGVGSFVIPVGGVNQIWSGFSATALATNIGNSPFTLSVAGAASGGNTSYTGTITGYTDAFFVGQQAVITGFVTGSDNGTFTVVAGGSTTTLIVNNAGAAGETHAGTATITIKALPVQSEYVTAGKSNIMINVSGNDGNGAAFATGIDTTPVAVYQLT